MPCYVTKPHPVTRREAYRQIGYTDIEAERFGRGRLDEMLPMGDGLIFTCGENLVIEICRCGHEGAFLCDYPIGKGQTCDVPMCEGCRRNIGVELDLCEIHLWEFKRKSGRRRLP